MPTTTTSTAASTFTSLGIGSGLDLNTLLSGLMAVERQPLQALQTKLDTVSSQLSAMGQLKSALSTFQDSMSKLSKVESFKASTATSSDTDVLTATTTTTAAKGSYSINISRIAENHRLAANTTYANSSTTTIGGSGDTMTITVGSGSFTVGIGGKTLAGVRDAINGASDNTGVTASIVHDDAGYRLLLSANDTGSAHFVTATYSGTDPFSLQSLNTDRNASGSFTSADLDAVIRVEGFQITSSSNTLDSAIDGVTLNLVANGSSTLTINRDDGTITKNAQSFTDSANKLLSTLRSMKSGALSNYGALLRGVETQVRSVLTSAVSAGGKFSLLDQLGISIQRDGTFTLDNTKLASALQSDFASVAAIFTDTTNGVAVKLNAVMNQYLQSGGILQSQTNGLNSRQTSIQDQQTAMQKRLDLIQARYTKQFSALDSLVANIQSTGSFLTRALG